MKRFISILLSALFIFSVMAVSASAEGDYTIVSPYEDVVWSGDNAWKAYKGNLHTHSTVSDADMDYNEMIIDHYNQGYDFLAMTDHGVTGKAWNEEPTHLPLYLYQYIAGNKTTKLTDEQFEGITSGTYPVDGKARGYGMTCVTGGNELNALTITKCHVNGMFLPPHKGDNYLGYENDHEGAVKLADKANGLSFINHPGDWLRSKNDISIVSDPKNVHYFSDIILKYDSCLGMEVFNENNGVTPYDRILWDNILMECLPYGKNVIGFSNNDAHNHGHIDSSFSVFMMKDNTVENIKETMQSGAFFCVTRILRENDKIGPYEDLNAKYSETPYPSFTEISVDGHKVTVKAKDCNNIQWIANGNVIASKAVEQCSNETEYVLDLDEIDGAEDFLYIRCELFGEGGLTLSQALIIDNGSEPMKYTPDTSVKAKADNFFYRILSLRIFALIDLIIYKIKY
ncbi:MAG: hypothetical protein MJ177_06715 [Clostridia bacterium]|nr:hypothetical protein [Clostridia bacterium]